VCAIHETKKGDRIYTNQILGIFCAKSQQFFVCVETLLAYPAGTADAARTRRADFQQKPYYVEPNVRTKRRSTARGRKTQKIHVGTLESPEEMKSLEEI
jgi:hypothetical protein